MIRFSMPFDSEKLLSKAESAAAGGLSADQRTPSPGTSTVLTFYWDGELYGLPIGEVREISKIGSITPVPGLPAALLGAMNLRGEVLPIFDLRPLVGLDPARPSPAARLLVVAHHAERVGVLVDSIGDINEVAAPERLANAADVILGRSVLPDGTLLNLLDIRRALATFNAT